MNYVVAIAAPIGGGKTSLVNAIADELDNAITIHYDHYETATKEPASSLVEWMKKGADFSDFKAPNLSDDLERVKRGESIIHPLTNMEMGSGKYIVFEMPLGKEHRDTAKFIDLLIWIEIPLDIALARKVREYISLFLKDQYKDCMLWLDQYLAEYLEFFREVLQIQRERVSKNADIVLDGQEDFEDMVQRATKEILKRIP